MFSPTGIFHVAGVGPEGLVLWATLHNGQLTWTDDPSDAWAWPEDTARFIRDARCPDWLASAQVVAPAQFSELMAEYEKAGAET